jgi:hypothetical protein
VRPPAKTSSLDLLPGTKHAKMKTKRGELIKNLLDDLHKKEVFQSF